MDEVQVSVAGADTTIAVDLEAIFFVEKQVEGRANGDIGAHSGVEREQSVLGGDFQGRGGLNAAIENGAAVFTFAELQIQRIFGSGKGIALGINQVEVGILASNLAPEQEVNIEAEGVALEGGAIDIRNPADAVTHDAGGIVKRARLGQTLSGIEIVAQQGDDGLADGEAAAGKNDEDALAGLDKTIHLAANVDLVKTGVSPGIGGKYEAFLRGDTQTIGQLFPSGEVTA